MLDNVTISGGTPLASLVLARCSTSGVEVQGSSTFHSLTHADIFHGNLTVATSTTDNATMSESQKLLQEHPDDSDSDLELELEPEPKLSPARQPSPLSPSSSRQSSTSPAPPNSRPKANGHGKRQSSFAQPRPQGTPRTPNRVHFDDDPVRRSMNGEGRDDDWIEMEGADYMDDDGPGRERVQRLPLLTGIEAPSVTVAEEAFDPEEHLESARPRSGMRSAFMNMANSIIGAGIIGQPYAFRNAGLITGTILLIGLTITVDWTIRLIVINSKLSGTDSFQATVEHCFGKSGLVAISLAQWLLYVHGSMIGKERLTRAAHSVAWWPFVSSLGTLYHVS
jgi:sodium-coupled neutral amino acid transporter 11